MERLELKVDDPILICRGSIFERAVEDLKQKYGEVSSGKGKRKGAKSFIHMMRWLKKNPDKIKYAKIGWPCSPDTACLGHPLKLDIEE